MADNTYRTIQGDTWDLISYKLYGTGAYMPLLMDRNPAYAYTSFFPAGVVLTAPTQPSESPDDLPPWRQVELE